MHVYLYLGPSILVTSVFRTLYIQPLFLYYIQDSIIVRAETHLKLLSILSLKSRVQNEFLSYSSVERSFTN